MTKQVCVVKVPECGHVVIGRRTYGVGAVVNVDRVGPEGIKDIDVLLQGGYITVWAQKQ